jgi:hypothetical protein
MKSIAIIKQLKGAVQFGTEEEYPYIPPKEKTMNI